MLIERRVLSKIIAQEVLLRLRELVEAKEDEEGGDDAGKRKRGPKPSVADAEGSPSPKGDVPAGPRADTDGSDDDPVEPDLSDDEGLDQAGDAGEDPSGAINNEIAGKSVQALTIEPSSKVLPGAKEVVLTFSDSTDALRILITSTGQVKFFWRGELRDLP